MDFSQQVKRLAALLNPEWLFYVWLASGAALLILWSWVTYRFVRWALGHKKIDGVWFSSEHLEEMLDILQRSALDGVNLKVHEVNMLDKFRPDWRPHLKKLGDKEFVGWADQG